MVAVLVAGCATAYQPRGISGGFSEVMRTDFIYLVRFQGNGYTPRERAEDMAFLRAAELTLEKGYRFFTVLGDRTRVDRSAYVTPIQSTSRGSVDRFGNYRGRTSVTGGDVYDISKPHAELLVGMAPDSSIEGHLWYDAAKIVADMKPKLK